MKGAPIDGLPMTPRLRSGIAACLVAAAVVAGACTSSETGSADRSEAPTTPTPAITSEAPLPIGAGGWLAYQAPSSSSPDRIFLTRVDGSDDHEIARQLPGSVAHPDFSRDGTLLAFDQLDSDVANSQIFVADADGSHIRQIAPCHPPGCRDRYAPSWSPDGKRLAVATDGGPLTATGPSRFGIAIIDVDTQHVSPIVDHSAAAGQDLFPRWSPDGTRLVFWRDRAASDGSRHTAVFVVDADGSGLRRLTPWEMDAGDPDWRPNGSLIVFDTHPLFEFPEGVDSELYTIRPDGSGMVPLTSYGPDGPRATQPRWTPDGTAILYTRLSRSQLPRHIWVLTADGSVDLPVLDSEDIYTHPVLRPG
jgi:Tol biopolymer transport system component